MSAAPAYLDNRRERKLLMQRNPVPTEQELAWVAICPVDHIVPNTGVRALVHGEQVALFRVQETLWAIEARDPFSGAHVLSRGIVGDKGGIPTVASPLYKQAFSLETGACLSDPEVRVRTHFARMRDGIAEVALR